MGCVGGVGGVGGVRGVGGVGSMRGVGGVQRAGLWRRDGEPLRAGVQRLLSYRRAGLVEVRLPCLPRRGVVVVGKGGLLAGIVQRGVRVRLLRRRVRLDRDVVEAQGRAAHVYRLRLQLRGRL